MFLPVIMSGGYGTRRWPLSGEYFWNSGMFMFRAGRYIDELERYRPEILEALSPRDRPPPGQVYFGQARCQVLGADEPPSIWWCAAPPGVYRGDEVIMLSENRSIYIPLGEIHALENLGKIALQLIEVQYGSYLGEDDIVWRKDRYGRVLAQ